MSSIHNRWQITADKFLNMEQIDALKAILLDRRDLAMARANDTQAIRDYYLIRALLETVLRVFELCALVNADVQGTKLTVRRGKGNKPRTVLLTRTTATMLKEWSDLKRAMGHDIEPGSALFPSRYGKAYTTRGVQKRIKPAFEAARLPAHLSVHSLRHTYCSLLLASGRVSLATVKENLGHQSIAVTNLYANAVGDLSEIQLYPASSSEKTVLSESRHSPEPKKRSSSASDVLRKANFKRGLAKPSAASGIRDVLYGNKDSYR